MGVRKALVRIDVTQSVPPQHRGEGRQWIGALVVAPQELKADTPAPVVVCVHGGSYDKRYFDLQLPGRTGYSMAEHFAARGIVVVALDYLGISDSSRIARPDEAAIPVFVAAQEAATQAIFAQLPEGTLTDVLPPIRDVRRIGLAHSMGVMLTLKQQARRRSFSSLALLCYSVRGARSQPAQDWRPPADGDAEAQMQQIRAQVLRSQFYLEAVPMDVVLADEAASVPPTPLLGSQGRVGGVALQDAAAIDVPVLYGAGERGVFANPHEELSAFAACDDLTFVRFKGAAHALNLANTRAAAWDRIIRWILA
jgi:alpha-beta hydrolase superfamily lysophospholipase